MIRRVKLSDTVIEELLKMITNLKPGDRLPTEKNLAQIFGVGLSTLREGLKVLSVMGMVERRNEGTFVAQSPKNCLVEPLSFQFQMEMVNSNDVWEIRELLEIGMIKLLINRVTSEEITTLDEIVWEMSRPGSLNADFRKLDFKFHYVLAKIVGNNLLTELIKTVRDMLVRNLNGACTHPKIQKHAVKLLKNFVDAVRNRNLKEAQKSLGDHLKEVRSFYGFSDRDLGVDQSPVPVKVLKLIKNAATPGVEKTKAKRVLQS